MLTERQKSILNALTREYMAIAQPVSSGELVKKYKLPFSPATVRNEILALDREGFTIQPHTSAGRIPTDKGYRFFIGQNLPDEKAEKKIEKSFRPLCDIDDEFDFLRQISRMLVRMSGEFSMAGFLGKRIFYKSGIAEIIQYPEFADEREVCEFGELIDCLDEEVRNLFGPEDMAEPRVFIGEENPIREARKYSMVISSARTPFGEDGIFTILGPQRMNYDRNLSILRTLNKLLDEL